MSQRILWGAVASAILLVAAACGDSTVVNGGGNGGTSPTTTTAGGHGGVGGTTTTTSSSHGGSGGAGGQGASAGNGGYAGAANCDAICQNQGLTCCDGSCVATYDDIFHCGGCHNTCSGQHPYCDGQQCTAPPCEGVACPSFEFCCGTHCCPQNQLCCDVPGPGPSAGPVCADPVNGTCPVGCPLCN
jgi:hypothetical protein